MLMILQILLKAMKIQGEKHDGNWIRVKGMFKEGYTASGAKNLVPTIIHIVVLAIMLKMRFFEENI